LKEYQPSVWALAIKVQRENNSKDMVRNELVLSILPEKNEDKKGMFAFDA
jgi:hypothetical protein